MIRITDEIRNSLAIQMQSYVAALSVRMAVEPRFDLLVYCGYRSAFEQNRLYCMSRTLQQVAAKAATLRKQGFKKLADYLQKVQKQVPKAQSAHVTNASAGESLHNYGIAFDAVPLLAGKAMWDNSLFYKAYGQAAKNCGLRWGGDWHSFKDYPHCELMGYDDPVVVRTQLMPDYMEKLNG